ncbi:MAG: hypothetical protein O3A10_13565 [Chloroflexi bacterium]|nr:hypothetical protein [Chloroflexota bacterium]MDA1147935.1 hypothetical protein [Chloroflexota bacterium]
MIEKTELAEGIRFAGRRAAAALENVSDLDYQLSNGWTSIEMFRHVGQTAGGLEGFYGRLGGDVLNKLGVEAIAAGNATTLESNASLGRDEVTQKILEGAEASAAFLETCDEGELAEVVTLGGYSMPRAEVIAQIWIHHQIAHSYEASARWPLA